MSRSWFRRSVLAWSDLSLPRSRRRAVYAHFTTGLLLQAVLLAHAFLLVPMAVAAVGAQAYGYWLASGGLLGWLGLTNFGSATVTLQRCAHAYGSRDYQATRDWFAHGLVAAAVSSLLVVCVAIPMASLAPQVLAVPDETRGSLVKAITLAGLGSALLPVNDTARGFLCALQRNGIGVGAEIFGGLISLAVTWGGLARGWGLSALGAGILIRVAVAGLVNCAAAAWFMSRAAPRTAWQRGIFQAYLKSGTSLWSASAVGQLVPQLPPLVLTKILGPESAVAYIATIRPLLACEMLPAFAIGSMSSAVSHMAGDPEAHPRLQSRLSSLGGLLAFATIACAAAYSLGNAGFVRLWMGDAYYLGPLFTSCAAVAGVVASQVRWSGGISTALGAVGPTARILTLEGIVRAILMPLAVFLAGPLGIPVVTVICGVMALALLPPLPGNGTDALSCSGLSPTIRRFLLGSIPIALAAVISTTLPLVGWIGWVSLVVVGGAGVTLITALLFPMIVHAASSLRSRVSPDVPYG